MMTIDLGNSNSPELVRITRATRAACPVIADMARTIWNEHYPGIISLDQITYMLGRMYSINQLESDMANGVWFFLAHINGQPAGFSAVGPTGIPAEWKLHKLYVLPQCHRRGIGSGLVETADAVACLHGAKRLILAVNKRNVSAIEAYNRMGFQCKQSVVVDIGSGFVMDDFILSRPCRPGSR